MHLSAFLAYLSSNTKSISVATLRAVKAEARDRLMARLQAGRADSELTFTDLFDRCEREIASR